MHVTEMRGIADQLVRGHDGDAWYGTPTREVLRGLSPEQASARPIPRAHTIWEIVVHMTGWQREVLRRLRSGISREPEGGDWPAPPPPSAESWAATLADLDAAHRELLAEVDIFPADRLDEMVGEARDREQGSGVSYYVLLHGIVQHNLAHTAQMALLRKAFT
ncbi:MAG TPA: DinB family protein [Longimicrobium sp.]|nr:DinB family protein [Longimicrobium sp.]